MLFSICRSRKLVENHVQFGFQKSSDRIRKVVFARGFFGLCTAVNILVITFSSDIRLMRFKMRYKDNSKSHNFGRNIMFPIRMSTMSKIGFNFRLEIWNITCAIGNWFLSYFISFWILITSNCLIKIFQVSSFCPNQLLSICNLVLWLWILPFSPFFASFFQFLVQPLNFTYITQNTTI